MSGPANAVGSNVRHFESVDAFRGEVGRELGIGDWLLMDQDRVDLFAAATGDNQWIHVDRERAAAGPYGGTVAHGYLTLALTSVLGGRIFTVGGTSMVLNYGLEKVRFPHVVLAGSRIRARARLVSAVDVTAGVRAVVRYTVEIEGIDKPACVADSVRVMVPSE